MRQVSSAADHENESLPSRGDALGGDFAAAEAAADTAAASAITGLGPKLAIPVDADELTAELLPLALDAEELTAVLLSLEVDRVLVWGPRACDDSGSRRLLERDKSLPLPTSGAGTPSIKTAPPRISVLLSVRAMGARTLAEGSRDSRWCSSSMASGRLGCVGVAPGGNGSSRLAERLKR